MAIRLFLVVLLLAFVSRNIGAEPVQCRGIQYRASRVKAQGFCWYFFNGNYTMSQAISQCARHGGRLPAINSDNKADKMAEFSTALRHLYTNGSFDRSWLPVYARGWVGNIVWGDNVTNNRNHPTWQTTGAPVSYQGFDEDTQRVENGDSCTTFNIFTGKWQYAPCSGVNILLCEEANHDYADEKPTESCPYGFTLDNGRCLALSGGLSHGPFKANLFCNHRAGHLAVVTSENDEKALGNFARANRIKNKKTFLSSIMYDENKFVWQSTGQSADYVARKLNMSNKPGYLSKTLVALNPEGQLMLCMRGRCIGRAMCQANDQDYYDYMEDETEDYDYYE